MSDQLARQSGSTCRDATVTRRGVIEVAALASTLSAIGAGVVGGAASRLVGLDLYKVVYDPRYQAGLDFGQTAAASGHTTAAVSGDVTELWYHDLYHRWREGPAAIAGLTTLDAAFCLEGLAGDVWMRTVFRGEHRQAADGSHEHALNGLASLVARSHLLDIGPDWGVGLARMLTGPVPGDKSERSAALTISVPPHALAHRDRLVSWVIAPVQRS